MITKETLTNSIKQMEAQREQGVAGLNALIGAINFAKQQLGEMEKEEQTNGSQPAKRKGKARA